MPDFSMFDEQGNPIGGAPAAPPPGLGGPPLRPEVPGLLTPITVPASGGLLPSPVERSLGLGAPLTAPTFEPSGPVVPNAGPPVKAPPTLSKLSDLQARSAPAGGPAGAPVALGAGMPGVDAFASDTEALRAVRRQQIANEYAKRPGYTPARPETRQDTSGQRQRSMGPDPEITQRQREIQSGPQRLERVAPPEVRYSPLDVLSVAEPPADLKTDKAKIAWAKSRAEALTKQGISMSQALATGELDQPKAPDLSWRPKNWDKLTGEEQDALEAARVTQPKPPRTPAEIARDRQRLAIVEGIDARHKQALDLTGAANEAARARYDRDVELYGPSGIAGAVTAQAQAEQRAIDAAVGTHEAKGQADRAFLEEKARLLGEQDEAAKRVLDGINQTAADLRSAKIDPGSFWGSRSTPQKIALVIASGMGAFAQAMGQGPNTAQQILDKAVDDDVRAQLANIDKKSKDLTDGQRLYKQILEQTGDKIAAQDALRLAAHSAVDSQLAEAQQTAKSEQALSRIQELRGRYELQRLEQEAALSERMRGTEGVNFRVDPARAASYGGGPNLDKIAALQQAMVSASHGQAMVDMALGEAAAKSAKAGPSERAVLGGQTYDLTNVTSAAEGAKIRGQMGALEGMDFWLGKVEKAQKEYASRAITKDKLENAVQRYANALSKAEEQGIVKKDELELMTKSMTGILQGADVTGDLRQSHALTRNTLLTQAGAVPRRAR